jgi:hypothetical protein
MNGRKRTRRQTTDEQRRGSAAAAGVSPRLPPRRPHGTEGGTELSFRGRFPGGTAGAVPSEGRHTRSTDSPPTTCCRPTSSPRTRSRPRSCRPRPGWPRRGPGSPRRVPEPAWIVVAVALGTQQLAAKTAGRPGLRVRGAVTMARVRHPPGLERGRRTPRRAARPCRRLIGGRPVPLADELLECPRVLTRRVARARSAPPHPALVGPRRQGSSPVGPPPIRALALTSTKTSPARERLVVHGTGFQQGPLGRLARAECVPELVHLEICRVCH